MEHKLIMEGWRDWLDTAKGVATKFANDFVSNITTPVDAYLMSKKEAKRLYPVPSKVDLAINSVIRDTKEIRDLQDNAYRAEAFQHICAAFIISHRSKRIFSGIVKPEDVRRSGEALEDLQQIWKSIKGTFDPDDRKRDLKHNEIGLSFAEEYKNRSGLKFEDYSKIVQEFISTGEFSTSSSTKEGNVRTYNELLAKRAKDKEKLPKPTKKPKTMVAPTIRK